MIDETAEEIRSMRTHSSSVVAANAAHALEELLDREYPSVEEYLRELEHNSSALRRANPSHASLVTTQREIVETVRDADPESVDAAKARTEGAIEEVVSTIETAKHRAAEAAANRLESGMTVLTHDYSSTVLEALEAAARDGAHLEVYVTEARPRHLGRKTARVLGAIDRIETTLIVDSAAGHYLADVDQVLIGMDCIVDNSLYNRVGTYPIAVTAADQDVPVTVAGSSAKVVDGGFRFENDFRPPSEVIREPPEGFDVGNPAYDATPTRFIDSLVTEQGETPL
ncbi:MAG: translation initiation factor eIF-2B [Halodesulfurarchaeum sp.]